jgi:hypothetical protein
VIEEFDWTLHARRRLAEREFDRFEVEMTIRLGHATRMRNHGRADWLIPGRRVDGSAFEVVYDHPVAGDLYRVRVVSVWLVEKERLC